MKRRVKLYSSAAFLGNAHTRPSLGLNHSRAGAQGLQQAVTRSAGCSAALAEVPLACSPASVSRVWGRPPQSCVWTRPRASLRWIWGRPFLSLRGVWERPLRLAPPGMGASPPCPRSWSDPLLRVLTMAPGQRERSLESSIWSAPDDHGYVP